MQHRSKKTLSEQKAAEAAKAKAKAAKAKAAKTEAKIKSESKSSKGKSKSNTKLIPKIVNSQSKLTLHMEWWLQWHPAISYHPPASLSLGVVAEIQIGQDQLMQAIHSAEALLKPTGQARRCVAGKLKESFWHGGYKNINLRLQDLNHFNCHHSLSLPILMTEIL